jgi:O-succinylbenzoate synthase
MSSETVSPEWVVYIQGMDEVMPTLGRRDAFERAQKVNTAIAWDETHREPSGLDVFRPTVWAVPDRWARSPWPPDMAAADVEAQWKEWEQ